MAGVARTTGLGHAHATLYSTANLGFYVVDAGASLAAEGGIGKALELIAQAINPIAMNSEGTAGLLNIVVDDTQWDAASLQAAIRHLGAAAGSGDYDATGATVTAGGQFIVSA
jgi:hypothetical protein|tara:strand:+ start:1273 stop:1611 length:339 start_codon:yes stop_codon:yes gene_type:complete